MSVSPRDLLFYAGGECLERFGTLVWRPRHAMDAVPAFTRTGGASFIGSTGVLRSVSANRPRVSFPLVDGVRTPALCVEAAGTNAYDFSDTLSNAAWTKVRSSVVQNGSVPSPRGVASAASGVFALVEDTDAGQHRIEQTLPALTDDTPQATSYWVRASSRSVVYILTINKANRSDLTWFNLSTGEVGTTDPDHVAARILRGPLGGALRWWRVTVVWDSGAGATTPRATLGMSTGDGVSSYTGDGSSQIFVWNPQYETDKAVESSDIVTTSATDGTRGAETADFPIGFAPQELTLYDRFIEDGAASASAASPICQISTSSTDGRLMIRKDSSSGVARYEAALFVSNSQVAVAEMTETVDVPDEVEIAVVLTATALTIYWRINGGAIGSATAAYSGGLPASWTNQVVRLSPTEYGVQHLSALVAAGDHSIPSIRAVFP